VIGVRYVNKRKTVGRQRAIEAAEGIQTVDQLDDPVEKRAVELIRGAAPKPRKNFIEQKALALAQAVEDEWFPSLKKEDARRGSGSAHRTKTYP
jgi:hypothetical protein